VVPGVGGGLVFDASALIDIADADRALLTIIAREIAPVIVPTPILEEVETLSEADCIALGLTVLEPSIEQLTESAVRRGRLSEEDHLCLIVARDLGVICVTSDGALYDECVATGVAVWRGLRPLITLVELGRLDARAAIVTVRTIRATNSYITVSVVRAFAVEIRTAARRARRPL
jgi:hypothetical protein